MGEQYLPMKEQIKALYEERNFEELQEVFKDYSDALDVTLKNKKSFAFDREILDIYHIPQLLGMPVVGQSRC